MVGRWEQLVQRLHQNALHQNAHSSFGLIEEWSDARSCTLQESANEIATDGCTHVYMRENTHEQASSPIKESHVNFDFARNYGSNDASQSAMAVGEGKSSHSCAVRSAESIQYMCWHPLAEDMHLEFK